MNQVHKTSFDELYGVFCDLVTAVTGRPTWRKQGLQVAPRGPYATVYFGEAPSFVQDVVETFVDPDNGVMESPVGLTRLEGRVELFRNVAVASALDAAVRFRNSLRLENRFNDVWLISGLVGEVRIIDVSAMFRGDIEGRAEVRFELYADIGAPVFNIPDHTPGEIEHQRIKVFENTDDPPPVADVTIDKPT